MKTSHILISEINNLFNTKYSDIKITGASLDTRTLKKGNIFFAIKGKNNDGHKFINQAEKKGASIAFVQKINSKSNLKQIKVKNTLSALSSLARYYRSLLNTQIIGITGSVGKTGTKDAISFILKEHKNIFCSRQSYNNKYGMPLEILNMPRKTKFGFFELGMNHFGEIKSLVKILKPKYFYYFKY
jgi:UDP-N-acetylmuramyl pentapeptide synthase